MSTQVIVNKREKQRLATRNKLIQTVMDIFAEEGFDGITISNLAKRAGLSRGLCYHHFESKEQLLLETFRAIYTQHREAWENVLNDKRLEPVERLTRMIRALQTPPILEPNRIAFWVSCWGLARSRKAYMNICQRGDNDYYDAVAALLGEIAGDVTEINGVSIRSIAYSLTTFNSGLAAQSFVMPGQLTTEQAIDTCLTFLSVYIPQLKPERIE